MARQPRVWVALAAMAAAPLLAARDGRTGWTVLVAWVTAVLAGLSIGERYRAEHPEVERRERERHEHRVDAILWRYERQREARRRAAESGETAPDERR
jgi:hypothetical protein